MEPAPSVSIIVPIYKVEQYIARCLDSIKEQTFTDYEVIMIDDGSPDRSGEIAERYTADPRFRLFRQSNAGVGAVRNRGLFLARGEYIAFVDSDDMIKPDHLDKLYSAAAKGNADIVCCSYCCCDENGKHLRPSMIRKHRGVYNAERLIGNILRDISIRRYMCTKLWRRSLFIDNGIIFPERMFEDTRVIPILFYHAKKISVITDTTYIYTRRAGSITSLTSESCVGDYIAANEAVESFYMNTREAEFYRWNLRYQKVKTVSVTFCWLFIRMWRAKTLDCFGTNLAKIVRYALPGRRTAMPLRKHRAQHGL